MEWLYRFVFSVAVAVTGGVIVLWVSRRWPENKSHPAPILSDSSDEEEVVETAVAQAPQEYAVVEKDGGIGWVFTVLACVIIGVIAYKRPVSYTFLDVGPAWFSQTISQWPVFEPIEEEGTFIFHQRARSFEIALENREPLKGRFDWYEDELCFSLKNDRFCSVPSFDEVQQVVRIIDPLGDGTRELLLRPITGEVPQ